MKEHYNQYSKLWQLPKRSGEPHGEWDEEEQYTCNNCEEDQDYEEDWDEEDYSLEYLDDRQESRFPLFKPEPYQPITPFPIPIPRIGPWTPWIPQHPNAPQWPFGQYTQGKKPQAPAKPKDKKCPPFLPDKKKATANKNRACNCAGLAFRTYGWYNLEKTKATLKKFATKSKSCETECNLCDIKFWFWEVEMKHLFWLDDLDLNTGKTTKHSAEYSKSITSDFHIVSGMATVPSKVKGKGKVPKVYSKDGVNELKGPKEASSFAPVYPKYTLLDSDGAYRELPVSNGGYDWYTDKLAPDGVDVPSNIDSKSSKPNQPKKGKKGHKVTAGWASIPSKKPVLTCWCMSMKKFKAAQKYIKGL